MTQLKQYTQKQKTAKKLYLFFLLGAGRGCLLGLGLELAQARRVEGHPFAVPRVEDAEPLLPAGRRPGDDGGVRVLVARSDVALLRLEVDAEGPRVH